jgi:S1-C subfamily serine protease
MPAVAILKSVWRKDRDGSWGIHDIKGLALKPRAGFDSDFFPFQSQLELLTSHLAGSSIPDLLSSFGPTEFLMKQSILPVVAWVEGDNVIRCIGTAFVISCTGYLITACHVLLDP